MQLFEMRSAITGGVLEALSEKQESLFSLALPIVTFDTYTSMSYLILE